MEFNTQSIETLAEQFTGIIQAEIEAGESYGIREIETEMRRWLQALGQKRLGMLLSQAEGVPERQLRCECGGTLHYQRQRGAQIQRVFGWVQYRRSYYAGCRCGQGHAPVDTRFGLQSWSDDGWLGGAGGASWGADGLRTQQSLSGTVLAVSGTTQQYSQRDPRLWTTASGTGSRMAG